MERKQLTKSELKELSINSVITEKFFNEIYNWKITATYDINGSVVHYMEEITSRKKSKLIISDNFNKEGDRKYKTKKVNAIVKYYNYG